MNNAVPSNILLSVIMPTYNRSWIIERSIGLLKEQVVKNSGEVELIVCNNASTDDTDEVISKLHDKDDFFQYISYSEHKEIGISISRSVENANGKFILLWGDDDVPNSGMIDVLLASLRRHPDVDCIHFNRIQGFSQNGKKNEMNKLRVFYDSYEGSECLFESSEEFYKACFRGMAFLSVNLMSKEAWNKGLTIYTTRHLGFEFMAPILYGINKKKSLYISYPLCIQRCLSKPSYREKWPAYLYVGIPRLLIDLQNLDVIGNWKELYNIFLTNPQFNSSFVGYVNNIVYWASKDKEYYKSLVKEINKYQSSYLRKMVTCAIFLPEWLLKIFRFIIDIAAKILHIEQ